MIKQLNYFLWIRFLCLTWMANTSLSMSLQKTSKSPLWLLQHLRKGHLLCVLYSIFTKNHLSKDSIPKYHRNTHSHTYILHFQNAASIYILPSLSMLASKLVTKMEMNFFVTILQYLMVMYLISLCMTFPPCPITSWKKRMF